MFFPFQDLRAQRPHRASLGLRGGPGQTALMKGQVGAGWGWGGPRAARVGAGPQRTKNPGIWSPLLEKSQAHTVGTEYMCIQ